MPYIFRMQRQRQTKISLSSLERRMNVIKSRRERTINFLHHQFTKSAHAMQPGCLSTYHLKPRPTLYVHIYLGPRALFQINSNSSSTQQCMYDMHCVVLYYYIPFL